MIAYHIFALSCLLHGSTNSFGNYVRTWMLREYNIIKVGNQNSMRFNDIVWPLSSLCPCVLCVCVGEREREREHRISRDLNFSWYLYTRFGFKRRGRTERKERKGTKGKIPFNFLVA
jgi:hypothetical protein